MRSILSIASPTTDVEAAETVGLLQATARAARQVAGGVTHDLNSALQSLGDALFVLREDVALLRGQRTGDSSDPFQTVVTSLDLADKAFESIAQASKVVATLVPHVSDDDHHIHLETELAALVTLTRHHWKDRFEVVLAVEPSATPVRCTWWIARLATLRMLLLAVESRESTLAPGVAGRLPRVHLSGGLVGSIVSIGVRAERTLDHRGAEQMDPDSVVALCARRLGGEMLLGSNGATNAFDMSLRFRVHDEPFEAAIT